MAAIIITQAAINRAKREKLEREKLEDAMKDSGIPTKSGGSVGDPSCELEYAPKGTCDELTALRQSLKERDELIGEVLPIIERYKKLENSLLDIHHPWSHIRHIDLQAIANILARLKALKEKKFKPGDILNPFYDKRLGEKEEKG